MSDVKLEVRSVKSIFHDCEAYDRLVARWERRRAQMTPSERKLVDKLAALEDEAFLYGTRTENSENRPNVAVLPPTEGQSRGERR